MKKYFKNLKADKLVVRIYLLSILLLILTLVVILASFTKLPPLLPIYNQLPWGQARLAPTFGIFIPIIITTLYFILNVILSAYSYEKYPIIARILAVTTCLVSLLTLLFVIRTITLII